MVSIVFLFFITVAISHCVAFLPNFGLKVSQNLAQLRPKSFTPGTALFLSTADFKTGMTIDLDGTPVRLLEFLHVKPGKGAAFVRTKIRNLKNGSVQERTFRAGEPIIEADIEKFEMQYMYSSGDSVCFMNMATCEDIVIDQKLVPDEDLLTDGMTCYISFWKGKVIDVTLPQQAMYTVESTSMILKGQKQGEMKEATLDSGAKISVPVFIEQGEQIMVTTEDRKYYSRVSAKNFNT